jgi:hypothetical protein
MPLYTASGGNHYQQKQEGATGYGAAKPEVDLLRFRTEGLVDPRESREDDTGAATALTAGCGART